MSDTTIIIAPLGPRLAKALEHLFIRNPEAVDDTARAEFAQLARDLHDFEGTLQPTILAAVGQALDGKTLITLDDVDLAITTSLAPALARITAIETALEQLAEALEADGLPSTPAGGDAGDTLTGGGDTLAGGVGDTLTGGAGDTLTGGGDSLPGGADSLPGGDTGSGASGSDTPAAADSQHGA